MNAQLNNCLYYHAGIFTMSFIGILIFTFLKIYSNTHEAKKKILYHYYINKYRSIKEIVFEFVSLYKHMDIFLTPQIIFHKNFNIF